MEQVMMVVFGVAFALWCASGWQVPGARGGAF